MFVLNRVTNETPSGLLIVIVIESFEAFFSFDDHSTTMHKSMHLVTSLVRSRIASGVLARVDLSDAPGVLKQEENRQEGVLFTWWRVFMSDRSPGVALRCRPPVYNSRPPARCEPTYPGCRADGTVSLPCHCLINKHPVLRAQVVRASLLQTFQSCESE